MPQTGEGLGEPELQGARLLASRFHPPHAEKALQSHMMFPDRLSGRGSGFEPTTAANSFDGCRGFMSAGLGLRPVPFSAELLAVPALGIVLSTSARTHSVAPFISRVARRDVVTLRRQFPVSRESGEFRGGGSRNLPRFER